MAQCPGARLILTRGLCATDKNPTRHELQWADLIANLKSRVPATGEKDGEWYCFSDFGTEPKWTEPTAAYPEPRFIAGWRAYSHLEGAHCVVVDLDTHAPPFELLAGYTYAAWTTYKNAPNAPRWRVVFPLSEPANRYEYYVAWDAASALCGGADGAAKDATRLNYLPGACLHPEIAQVRTNEAALFPVFAAAVPEGTVPDEWTTDPVERYSCPYSDAELIEYMLRGTRAERAFNAPMTYFAALWHGDEAFLAHECPPGPDDGVDQVFSRTKADSKLANEGIYYTGGNCERTRTLLEQAPLWQRDSSTDNKRRRAILLAARRAPDQYHFLRPVIPPPPAPVVTVGIDGAVTPPSDVPNPVAAAGLAQAGDFFAYLPQHDYIHRPTGMHWPAASLDGTVGKDTRMALDLTHPVHLLSWAPGLPERFQWRELDETNDKAADSWTYNRYQAPRKPRRSGAQIDPWLKLLNRLYPNDAGHILKYFADAVQNPGRKCNHALVLGSEVHGIGKDTLLKPLKWAVGEKNYATISPAEIFDKNNAWAASVVVQISETRNVGDGQGDRISKYDMYERCKDLAAAPPTTLSCQDKWVARHQVRNVLRPIYTTNHGVDGIYIPLQDRRHYCAWSDAGAMSEADALAMHKWLDAGGSEEVAAFLYDASLLDGWNPGARPPQTDWWHRLVLEGMGEENPLAEAIERIGSPEWITAEQLAKEGGPAVAAWFADSRNRKGASRHFATLGYRRITNPNEKRGRYMFNREARTVYGKPSINPATFIPAGR